MEKFVVGYEFCQIFILSLYLMTDVMFKIMFYNRVFFSLLYHEISKVIISVIF